MYKLLFVLLFVSANAFAQPFGVDSRYTEKVDAFTDEIVEVRLKLGSDIWFVWAKSNNKPYVQIHTGVKREKGDLVNILVRVDKGSTETITLKAGGDSTLYTFDPIIIDRFAHILANNELIAIRIPGVKKDREFLIHELNPISAMFVTDKSNTTRADIVKFSKFVNTGISQL